MSRHYLLDGYNIIKQTPALADRSLEDGRAGLVRWIHANQPQGSANNKVTVIFDGNPDNFGGSRDGGAVEILFSQYGSADDTIKAIIDRAANKSTYVVVSNDKGITHYVKAQGAGVLSVQEFLTGLKAGKASRGPNGKVEAPLGKYISLSHQDKINQELSKLWLKDK